MHDNCVEVVENIRGIRAISLEGQALQAPICKNRLAFSASNHSYSQISLDVAANEANLVFSMHAHFFSLTKLKTEWGMDLRFLFLSWVRCL